MPAPNEIELVNPLTGEEIKISIAHKIAEAVMESLDKHCALNSAGGVAYPKFKAKWVLHYELDNFGLTREGNIAGVLPAQEHSEVTGEYVNSTEPMETAVAADLEGEIPFTPPNQLRKETDQAVPVQVINERGVQSEKAILYQPKRGVGRPRKVR